MEASVTSFLHMASLARLRSPSVDSSYACGGDGFRFRVRRRRSLLVICDGVVLRKLDSRQLDSGLCNSVLTVVSKREPVGLDVALAELSPVDI